MTAASMHSKLSRTVSTLNTAAGWSITESTEYERWKELVRSYSDHQQGSRPGHDTCESAVPQLWPFPVRASRSMRRGIGRSGW